MTAGTSGTHRGTNTLKDIPVSQVPLDSQGYPPARNPASGPSGSRATTKTGPGNPPT